MQPLILFKALADDTRLSCVLLLLKGELCVCDLMSALDLSQPKISRHLAILKKSGLLLDRRQGQWVYYRLNVHMPAWAYDIIRGAAQANRDYGQQGQQQIHSGANCC